MVLSVTPDKIRVQVKDIEDFNDTGEKFSVESYIRIRGSSPVNFWTLKHKRRS